MNNHTDSQHGRNVTIPRDENFWIKEYTNQGYSQKFIQNAAKQFNLLKLQQSTVSRGNLLFFSHNRWQSTGEFRIYHLLKSVYTASERGRVDEKKECTLKNRIVSSIMCLHEHVENVNEKRVKIERKKMQLFYVTSRVEKLSLEITKQKQQNRSRATTFLFKFVSPFRYIFHWIEALVRRTLAFLWPGRVNNTYYNLERTAKSFTWRCFKGL